jgi:hypothetical protein
MLFPFGDSAGLRVAVGRFANASSSSAPTFAG